MEKQLEKIFKRKEGRSNYDQYLHKDADVEILMEDMSAIKWGVEKLQSSA